jgi:hypothetical protein
VLAPFIPTRGDFVVEPGQVWNLILWGGMSEEWVTVLNELFAADLLWRAPCSILVYLSEGGVPQLPIPKRAPPKGGYKTLHWAPSCLRPIEHIAPAERERYGGPDA